MTLAVEFDDDEEDAFATTTPTNTSTSTTRQEYRSPPKNREGARPTLSRRHRHDADTAAAVSARKYAFRRRVLTIMASTLVVTAATAFLLTSSAWWLFSTTSAATVLYLGYLRRQTRIEERVQRRRAQRMARPIGRREHLRPRVRRRPVAAAAPRRRRPGDRRRRPDLRASRVRDPGAGVQLAPGPAARRWAVDGSATSAATGSLLPIRGYGAVGSATRSHRVGQGFDSP